MALSDFRNSRYLMRYMYRNCFLSIFILQQINLKKEGKQLGPLGFHLPLPASPGILGSTFSTSKNYQAIPRYI